MFSLLLGSVLTIAIVIFSLSGANYHTFFNLHSMVLVFGGTLGTFLLATPFEDIWHLLTTMPRMFHGRRQDDEDSVQAVIAMSRGNKNFGESAHPLVLFVSKLNEQGIDTEVVRSLLDQKYQQLVLHRQRPVAVLRNIAKYPPALGMTGTVVGLVSLFSNLSANNREVIGPYLAIAMTATFYGLILANAMLLPLADRLEVHEEQEIQRDTSVYYALVGILQGDIEEVIQEGIRALPA